MQLYRNNIIMLASEGHYKKHPNLKTELGNHILSYYIQFEFCKSNRIVIDGSYL